MMILLYLLAAHALCDYPLQGDFLARGKNHRSPIPGVPWYQCMAAHSIIHAGAVVFITGNVWFGVIEFVGHFYTDYLKCDKHTSFNFDQIIHAGFKVMYVVIMFGMGKI